MYKQTAQSYRAEVWTASKPSVYLIAQEGDNKDAHLYNYLKQMWETNLPKFHLLYIKEKQVPLIETYQDFRVSLFVAGIGLMTYGHKNAIPFVLQNIPKLARLHLLATIVFDLLPLPEELKTLQKKTEILGWLEVNYENLIWDAEKEIFYLESK